MGRKVENHAARRAVFPAPWRRWVEHARMTVRYAILHELPEISAVDKLFGAPQSGEPAEMERDEVRLGVA